MRRRRAARIQPASFTLAIATTVIAVALCACVAAASDDESAFDPSNTEISILNPDTREVIGHGYYKVTRIEHAAIVEGENKFLDGESDHEIQRVDFTAPGAPPVLVNYRHSFFNHDGSPQSIDSLDAKSGIASCTLFEGSDPEIQQSKVVIPPDTYAGSTQMMLLVGRLRQGARDMTLHSFICLPGPRIVTIKATGPETTSKWPMYPGNLVKVEMVPDLGWMNPIAGLFVPKAYGWFDPGEDFDYVGGLFDRFYRRRHVMMLRTRHER